MAIATQIDTNDAFDWSERTTEEFVQSGQTFRNVTTTFDDGHLEVRNFVDGLLTQWSLTDPTDVLPVQSQQITYAAFGNIITIDALDDGSVRTLKTYAYAEAFGVAYLVSSVKTDEGNSHPWATISTGFDGGRRVTEREVVFDNGDVRAETYFIGTLTQKVTTTSNGNTTLTVFDGDKRVSILQEDVSNSATWTSISTRFNIDGEYSSKIIIHDNGMQETIYPFANDAGRAVRKRDFGDLWDWDDHSVAFDADGQKLHEQLNYDNGVSVTTRYTDGIATSVTENDTGNVEDWTQKSSTYSVLHGTGTYSIRYDDGGSFRTVTQDGVLVSRTESDERSQTPWKSRTQTFENGVELTRTILFDDGGSAYYENENLIRRSWSDRDDSASWSSFVNTYSSSGELVSRRTDFDSGQWRHEIFTDGVRTYVDRNAPINTETWTRIEMTFDLAGNTTDRTISFVGGVSQHDVFSEGMRSVTTRTDGGGTKIWDTSVTRFDQSGAIISKTVTFDDGVVQQERHDEGELTSQVRMDLNDVFLWQTITSSKNPEDDSQWIEHTEFDNGDEAASLLEDGQRLLHVEMHQTQPESWLVRVSEYAGGDPSITTYDQLDDVPQIYLDLLGTDTILA